MSPKIYHIQTYHKLTLISPTQIFSSLYKTQKFLQKYTKSVSSVLDLHTNRKKIKFLAQGEQFFNQKSPGRLAKMSHGQVIYYFLWCMGLANKKQTIQRFKFSLKNTYTK